MQQLPQMVVLHIEEYYQAQVLLPEYFQYFPSTGLAIGGLPVGLSCSSSQNMKCQSLFFAETFAIISST